MTENPIVKKPSNLERNLETLSLTEQMKVYAQYEGYKEVPVSIDQFLDDDYYGGRFWSGDAIYPFWREKLREIYPNPFTSPFEEICVTGAIGIGKTNLALIGTCYDLYKLTLLKDPHKKFGLISTTIIAVALFTSTKDLGGTVLWSQLSDVFSASPYFTKILDPQDHGVLFPNKIGIKIGSRFGHALGQAIISGIIDEANFQDRVKNQALDNYNSIKRRMQSRFMQEGGGLPFRLWLISSKTENASFLETHIDKNRKVSKVKVIEAPIWKVHAHKNLYSGKKFKVFVGDANKDPYVIGIEIPDHLDDSRIIDVPIEYQREFNDDLLGSLRDIAGYSTTSGLKIFRNKEAIAKVMIVPPAFTADEVVLPFEGNVALKDFLTTYLRSCKNPTQGRCIHIDTALKGDSMGLAMSHASGIKRVVRLDMSTGEKAVFEENIVLTDFAVAVKAQKGSEIPFFKVREFIIYLRDILKFNIIMISTDGFQSADMKQLFVKQGFETSLLSVDRTKEQYLALKSSIVEGRSYLPKNAILENELKELEDVGKKIDHPADGSKDIADAVCGSSWNCQDLVHSSQLYTDSMIGDMAKDLAPDRLFGGTRGKNYVR